MNRRAIAALVIVIGLESIGLFAVGSKYVINEVSALMVRRAVQTIAKAPPLKREPPPVLANAAVLQDPEPVPPTLEIKCPTSVLENNIVHVQFVLGGGPTRELYIETEPELVEGNVIYNYTDDGLLESLSFTAEPGAYTLKGLAIAKGRGVVKAETRTIVRRKSPPPPAVEISTDDPKELIAQWVAPVVSKNKPFEVLQLAKAARTTAASIREGKLDRTKPDSDWADESYRLLGLEFRKWNVNPAGLSMFDHVSDLFKDAVAKKIPPENMLDNVAAILEGLPVE